MNTPAQRILKLLKESTESLSGEQIASELDVSRTAVWKVIDSLRKQGFMIDGVQNRGYSLISETRQLSEDAIKSRLSDDWHDIYVRCYETITSTNTFAKAAVAESKLPCLIATNGQSSGRGRRGRTFHSPEGVGLYFSIAFPWAREESPTLVTTMTAVAVHRVLARALGIKVDIKWVNDLFLNGKKIGGILTEATTDLNTGQTEAIVVGIGINLERPDLGYPPDLQDIIGSITDVMCIFQPNAEMSGAKHRSSNSHHQGKTNRKAVNPSPNSSEIDYTSAKQRLDGTAFVMDEKGVIYFNRNALIAMIANELAVLLKELPDRSYLDEYREHCFVLGREVQLDDGRHIVPTDISDEGALIYHDGQNEIELASGEVRLVNF